VVVRVLSLAWQAKFQSTLHLPAAQTNQQ
jgi:hypothetical protein